MRTLNEMKGAMIPEYQERFDALKKIAFELHKLDEKEIEMQVIKKMAGVKMMIDHCREAASK